MSLEGAERKGPAVPPRAEGRARVRIWGVVLLSLLIPGLGHLHAGHGRAGILVWTLMTGIGLGATLAFHLIWPGPVVLGLVVGFFLLAMVAVAVDAASRAVRDRRRGAVPPSPRLWQYGAFLLCALGVNLAPDLVPSRFTSTEGFSIASGSGLPNLVPGDRIAGAMSPEHRRTLRRGDLILFRFPGEPETTFIHRLVGLPGDTVAFTADGHLTLNGGPVMAVPETARTEPPFDAHVLTFRETLPNDGADGAVSYLIQRRAGEGDHGTFLVPAGHVFVLGDNRDAARDSRFIGPIPIADILGIASFVYWPGAGQAPRDWSRLGGSLLPELQGTPALAE